MPNIPTAIATLKFVLIAKPEVAKYVLRHLDDSTVKLVHEIAYNCVYNESIDISKSQQRKLLQQKKKLTQLAAKSVSIVHKRRIIAKLPLAYTRFLLTLAVPLLELSVS